MGPVLRLLTCGNSHLGVYLLVRSFVLSVTYPCIHTCIHTSMNKHVCAYGSAISSCIRMQRLGSLGRWHLQVLRVTQTFVMGSLRGGGARGGYLRQLGKPRQGLGKTSEYWGVLSYLLPLDPPPLGLHNSGTNRLWSPS